MRFEEALGLLRRGCRVRRWGWGLPGDRMHWLRQSAEGRPIELVTGTGCRVFEPSQEDLVSLNWGAMSEDLWRLEDGQDPRENWMAKGA